MALKWYQSKIVQAAIAGSLVAGVFAVIVALIYANSSSGGGDTISRVPMSAIPDNLAVSVVPAPDPEALHRMQTSLDYAKAERDGGNIKGFLVQYVRTSDFPSASPAFEWHLQAQGYGIKTESAMLVAAGSTTMLERCGGAQEVYAVPPGSKGDHLSVVMVVSSKDGEVEAEITEIVISAGRRRGTACVPL